MSVFAILLATVCFSIISLLFIKGREKPEQSIHESHHLKVKHILDAKDFISSNERIKQLFESMTNLYERDDTPWVKEQRILIMNKVSEVIYDHDIVAAICAIAKMEASKRRMKKNGKRVTGKTEVWR